MTSSINFELLAKKTLQKFADQFEAETDLDVELVGLELIICDSRRQTFLLNFHNPTNQLWLSSPVSGAHHFCLKEGNWVSTRTSIPLTEILSADIHQLFKDIVNL